MGVLDWPTKCTRPHGIAIIGNDLIYSDIAKRKLYKIKRYEEVTVNNQCDIVSLAGTGANWNEDGIGGDCQFSQPTGMCNEGNTLFVINSGSKNVRIVTSLSALHKYLSAFSKLYIFCTFWYIGERTQRWH